MIAWLIKLLGGAGRTKKVWIWLRWVLLAVIALVATAYIVVKVWTEKTRIIEEEKTARVQAEKYAGELRGYYDAQVALNKDKDKKLRDLTIKLENSRTVKFTHTLLDPVTGLPTEIFETTSEWKDTEERIDRDEVAIAPSVTLVTPVAPASLLGPSCPVLRPLGFVVGMDTSGGLAAGLRWRLVPIVDLPFVSDLSISVEALGVDVLGSPGGLFLADVEFWRIPRK